MKQIIVLLLFLIPFRANAANYYVSAKGSDGADGTTTGTPWLSIDKVNAAWLAGTFAPGDSILFNRGDTFYGSLIASESGTSGKRIVVAAYGNGARPVISGFTAIPGWTSEGSHIYSYTVKCESLTNMVTVDGINTAMGRYPDAGRYNTFESFSGSSSITDKSLEDTLSYAGGEVVLKSWPWLLDRLTITKHSGNTLTYSGGRNDPWENNGYFIQNHINTLTTQNEWYYDGSKFYIYSGGIPAGKVKISTLDEGVSINGRRYLTFCNLNIQGFNNSLFDVTSSSYITISNCDLKYSGNKVFAGNSGIMSNYNIITYCTIDEINNLAIKLSGNFNNTTISHNTMKNIGNIVGAGGKGESDDFYSGIYTDGPNTIIEFNDITNVGYNPIVFNRTSSGTIVRYNCIDRYCYNKDDGAGIYAWVTPGQSPGTRFQVTGNIILNGIGSLLMKSPGKGTQANGLYMDDRVGNVLLDSNTVYNCAGAGVLIHNAFNITLTNNTIIGSVTEIPNEGGSCIRFNDNESDAPGIDIAGITMTGNKFFSVTQYINTLHYTTDEGNKSSISGAFAAADSNYYIKPNISNLSVAYITYGLPDPSNWISLSGWRSLTGRELHSAGTPLASPLTSLSQFHFLYNKTSSVKTYSISAKLRDAANVAYIGNLELKPYTSLILLGKATVTEVGVKGSAGH